MKELNFLGIQRVKKMKSSCFLLLNAIAKLSLILTKPHRSNYMSRLRVFVVMALVHWNYLLWTVWYRKRECGLNLSSVSLYRDRLHKARTRTISVTKYWATMNTYTHTVTHQWVLLAWRIEQRFISTYQNEGLDSWKMSKKDGFFPEHSAVIPSTFTIAIVVPATVLPVCPLQCILYV